MRKQIKRLCSALLAAIVIVTAVPGTELTSYAVGAGREDVTVVDTVSQEDSISQRKIPPFP